MRGVGGFHFIEKREAFAGDMVADRDIIGVGLKAQDLKKQLATLQMRELGNFFDDLSETHTENLNRLPGRVQAGECGGKSFMLRNNPIRRPKPYLVL